MFPNIAFYLFIRNYIYFDVWVFLFKLFHYTFTAIAHSSLREHCYYFDVFIFAMVGKKFKKLCFGIFICAASFVRNYTNPLNPHNCGPQELRRKYRRF